ncbi:MAG: type II toxin-antitoxin system RelE/ParE family toxin [Bacteroidales bacterium]|nr:type II toxin-antitoxin system RelE/ParE family toxin [Bacteroidales bacterium]
MVIRKIIWSPRAKLDLTDILDYYYKRNRTKTFSKKLNLEFRKSIKLLEKHSDLGVNTDVQDIRNLIEGDYSIFYEIKSDTIEITTIWDNRQNPDSLDIKS